MLENICEYVRTNLNVMDNSEYLCNLSVYVDSTLETDIYRKMFNTEHRDIYDVLRNISKNKISESKLNNKPKNNFIKEVI